MLVIGRVRRLHPYCSSGSRCHRAGKTARSLFAGDSRRSGDRRDSWVGEMAAGRATGGRRAVAQSPSSRHRREVRGDAVGCTVAGISRSAASFVTFEHTLTHPRSSHDRAERKRADSSKATRRRELLAVAYASTRISSNRRSMPSIAQAVSAGWRDHFSRTRSASNPYECRASPLDAGISSSS